MPIPQEKEIRRPILEAVKGESLQSFSINDFIRLIADHFGEDLEEMSSVDKNLFKSRVKDAKTYLKVHKLISNPSKQIYMLTKTGRQVLEQTTGDIDDECIKSLSSTDSVLLPAVEELPEELTDTELEPETLELPDDIDMTTPDDEPEDIPEIPEELEEPEPEQTAELEEPEAEPEPTAELEEELPLQEDTPPPEEPEPEPEPEIEPEAEYEPEEEPEINTEEEYAEEITDGDENMPDEDFAEEELTTTQSDDVNEALDRHNYELNKRVLKRVSGLSSDTFERLVTDLLSKMGYRVFQNARYTNDASDNGMIQGVILDTQGTVPIYIHAKKLSPDRTVGRSNIQEFVDALSDKGGKGIFATAGKFSENAVSYAQDERIMLIDGEKLAGLMIAHNFCVNVEKVFELKELDEDSFNDYEN